MVNLVLQIVDVFNNSYTAHMQELVRYLTLADTQGPWVVVIVLPSDTAKRLSV